VQIQALAGPSRWQIQLAPCWNQGLDPSTTCEITGLADAFIRGTLYSGVYSLSTALSHQLELTNTGLGSAPGTLDTYGFLSGHDTVTFRFASDSSFAAPWLTALIVNVNASQQVPCQNCQPNDMLLYPSILLFGHIGSATGSLAGSFIGSNSQMTLDVGGNQRLSSLTPTNSFSGMSLRNGSINEVPVPVPEPGSLMLLGSGILALARRLKKYQAQLDVHK
jgi:hypothetical protein